MKGHRLILIICVIALSFAGVGYSAWTEGLNIKSMFATGDIDILFENPVIVSDGLDDIHIDADDGILEINGTVAPGATVMVEYDIYNGSSIPVKYQPDDDEILPEGVTLAQDDTELKPGEYLRGSQLTIEPGEGELILPFVQYNSSDKGGWKEEIKICWNITVVEKIVDPLLENAITEGALEVIPQDEEIIEDTPQPEKTPADTPQLEKAPENTPQPEITPADTPQPVITPEDTPQPEITPEDTPQPEITPEDTPTKPVVDPPSDPAPADPAPVTDQAPNTP